MRSRPDSPHADQSGHGGFSKALLDAQSVTPRDLIGRGGEIPQKRFSVYRNNVVVSLVEAIAATYPGVAALTGDEFFKAMARVYCLENPPKTAVLIDYGAGFPDFIEDFEPAQSLPYLADVARIEWAYTRAYHARDEAPIPITALNDIPPDDLAQVRFELHPSLQLVTSRYPAVSIWADCTDRAGNLTIDMTRGEEGLIIRPALVVDVRVLPSGGAQFIDLLAQDKTIGDAAECVMQASQGFELSSHLMGLFDSGCVIRIKL